MPWRLITFIVVLAVILAFITFNLENRSDIYFWYNHGLRDVPIFLTIFVSFTLGLFTALPFIISNFKKKKALPKEKKSGTNDNKHSGEPPLLKDKVDNPGGKHES
jgi:uncharacterized integral membrane protein